MSVTILVNGLTISHKGSGGYAQNSTPDVCKTPDKGIPIPYSIVSRVADLTGGTTTVGADGGNSIAIKGSAHARCTGDESGSMGGVVSGTNLAKSTWITYSPNVFSEGKNVCRKTDKLFMNNKNCISGTGGEYEVPLSVTDPILKELCKIFCEAREEWHKCKRAGAGKCDKPSKIAERKVNDRLSKPQSGLRKAIPSGKTGFAEKTFFGSADKMFDGARKVYDKAGLQRALKRQVDKLVKRKIVERGAKMAGKAWMKLVPGLNIVSTIADGVGVAMDVADVYNMLKDADALVENAIKIQPDFAIQGENGALEKVYDFKFDDPETGYIDDWQKKQMQEEAYEKLSGEKPEKVDEKTCQCDKGKGKGGPSVPSV